VRKGNKVRMVAIVGSQEFSGKDATAVILDASNAFRQRQAERLSRRVHRINGSPERLSVQRAMLAVEDRLVHALWVLARLPNERGVGYATRHGIDYTPDRVDRYAEAVAAGGWRDSAPRPAVPSAKAIDQMYEPLSWLKFLDRTTARLLTVAAQSKRGETACNISWGRVRQTLPELKDYTTNRLHRVYRDGLRTIVNELTLARMQ
jgi:hypothetical protein